MQALNPKIGLHRENNAASLDRQTFILTIVPIHIPVELHHGRLSLSPKPSWRSAVLPLNIRRVGGDNPEMAQRSWWGPEQSWGKMESPHDSTRPFPVPSQHCLQSGFHVGECHSLTPGASDQSLQAQSNGKRFLRVLQPGMAPWIWGHLKMDHFASHLFNVQIEKTISRGPANQRTWHC